MTEAPGRPDIAVVIPVFNEQDNVHILIRRFETLALATPSLTWKLIFVDDGSTDGTADRLLSGLAEMGPHLEGHIIELSRNFGKEAALAIGFAHANAEFVATVDADLQDPPELIPKMLDMLLETKADVVCGRRLQRRGESALRRVGAYLYYRIASSLADVRPDVDVGDFRLMRRQVAETLNQFEERSRFMKSIYAAAGFKRVFLPYDRDPRAGGRPKLSVAPLVDLAISGITSLSIRPLRLSTYLGLTLFALSFLVGIAFVLHFRGIGQASVTDWFMVLLLMMDGLLFLMLGLLGEYVGRILIEAKQRPIAVIRRRLGFPSDHDSTGVHS